MGWAAPSEQSGAGPGQKVRVIDCHSHLSFRNSPDEPGNDLQVLDAATERGLIVSIPLRVENDRQRSWLVDVPDLTAAEIAPLVKAKLEVVKATAEDKEKIRWRNAAALLGVSGVK